MKTLADRTQAFLADPLRGAHFAGVNIPPAVKRVLEPGFRELRMKLRQARRFTLDDDFLASAVETASVSPEILLRRLQLALLPYDSVWIEFNQRVRVKLQFALGTMRDKPRDGGLDVSKVPEWGGFLLYRRQGLAGGKVTAADAWVAHAFGDAADAKGEAGISSVCYEFSADPSIYPHMAELLTQSPLEQVDKNMLCRGWGYSPAEGRESQYSALLDQLFAHGCTLPDEKWAYPIISSDHAQWRAVWRLFGHDSQEQRGDLRFLVTVLAMVNCVPVKYVHRAAEGRFTRRLNSMDYLDSHTVTLHCGRAKVVNLLAREARAREQARKRAHEVRGFWRNVTFGKTIKGCAHLPLERNGNHAVCAKCGNTLAWVDHHVRGDASLGFVKKDYAVTL